MKINKEELRKALEIVKPGLANKEMIEQATSFAFLEDRVVTYNDAISISHPVPGLSIHGAIKADKLYGFLSKTGTKEIHIKADGKQIKMVAGKAKAGIAMQEEIRLPLDEEIGKKGKWKKLPKDFKKALDFAWPNCSADMTTPVLTCVNVNKDGRIEASDRLRLITYQIGELPLPGFLIPGTSTRELTRLDPTHMARGKGWSHFKTKEDTIFSCRVYEGEFPETGGLFDFEGTEIKFPKGITDAIQRAQVFAKTDHISDEWVEIKFSEGNMEIKFEGETDWFSEDIKCDYAGEEMSFKITPTFLLQILTTMDTCIKGEQALKFTGEDWQYVIAQKATGS